MADPRPNAGPPNPPLTDERLRQLAYDPIVASNANEVAMAIELLELRKQVATLIRMANRDCELLGRIVTAMGGDPEDVGLWPAVVDHAVAALATEAAGINPDTVADEFGIKSLAVEDGVPTLTTMPTSEQARALVLAMSLACGRMLDDDQAQNYVEFEVSPAGRTGQPGYVVHVRRAAGPSPHTLRREAEARVAELEAQLDRVTDLFESWAAEEAEHRRDGFLGIAEGLNVAIEELRQAVHGEPVNRIPACTACHGEGVVANTRNREPWSAWLSLPSGSDAAVRMGLVRPIPCPACGGKAESDVYALDPWTGRGAGEG